MKPRAPRRPGNVESVMRALSRAITGLELPAVEKISNSQQEDPFQVLIATLLSARTQDSTTLAASTRLFAVAPTPQAMVRLSVRQIEKLIKPVSFFHTKARHVKATCRMLLDRFGGQVPETMEELLLLPGVGRKTANVVLGHALGVPGFPVDRHVLRVSNRIGIADAERNDVRVVLVPRVDQGVVLDIPCAVGWIAIRQEEHDRPVNQASFGLQPRHVLIDGLLENAEGLAERRRASWP